MRGVTGQGRKVGGSAMFWITMETVARKHTSLQISFFGPTPSAPSPCPIWRDLYCHLLLQLVSEYFSIDGLILAILTLTLNLKNSTYHCDDTELLMREEIDVNIY